MTLFPLRRYSLYSYNKRADGGLAEWSKAVDLKSIVGQPTAGSNPAPSAISNLFFSK